LFDRNRGHPSVPPGYGQSAARRRGRGCRLRHRRRRRERPRRRRAQRYARLPRASSPPCRRGYRLAKKTGL